MKIFVLFAGLMFGIFFPVKNTFAQFSIRPVENESSWFVYSMSAGSKISSDALAVNMFDQPGTFEVYAVDAISDKVTGGFAPQSRGYVPVIIPSWIHLNQSTLEIPGKTATKVSFTIQIPQDVMPGEYTGALMIEPASDASKINSGGVSIATRIGARIYITVLPSQNGGTPKIADRIYESTNSKNVFLPTPPHGIRYITEETPTPSSISSTILTDHLESNNTDRNTNDQTRWIFNLILIGIFTILIAYILLRIK